MTMFGKRVEEGIDLFLEKNVPTNPSKWAYYKAQAKKKFDVYPSAYANGWAAKQYKAAGGGWRKEKKKKREVVEDVGIYKEVKIGRYDIGMGSLGNGITLWNRNVEKAGDYKKIAHIAPNGKVTNYEKRQPKEVTAFIMKIAKGMKDKPVGEVNEKKGDFLDSLFPKAKVQKAIKIAKKMSGNMTGAVKAIEKFFPGMSKHTQVQDALRAANEGLGDMIGKKVSKHKGSRNILSKADGIKKVKSMQKTGGAKIYKVDKVKTRLGGELITMYNLYTKNTNHSSMSNPYGLEMMRSGNKAAYLVPVKESVNEDVFAIVDKYNDKKQDYDQVYFKDNDLDKVKKHMKKMGSKYGKMNLIQVKPNGKMSLVEEKYVVYTGSGVKGRKIVKHGLSHMGAKRLYNKLVKTDNYDEVGFDDHKSWNQNNIRKVDELVTPMAVSNPAAYDALLNKQIAKDTKVKTAYNDKNHKMHGKAKSLVQRFLDKFKKKNGKKDDKPKKMSKTDQDFYKKMYNVGEGFGGELKGKDKEKFERWRKENATQLGMELTGVSDLKESSEKFAKMAKKRGFVKRGQSDKEREKGIVDYLEKWANKDIKGAYPSPWVRRIQIPGHGPAQDWWMDTWSVVKKVLGESILVTEGVPETIHQQLGGKRFNMMTGVKQLVNIKNKGLGIKIGGGAKKKINYVEIMYDRGKDLYDVTFHKIVKGNLKKVSGPFKGLDVEQMIRVFEKETGFYTKF